MNFRSMIVGAVFIMCSSSLLGGLGGWRRHSWGMPTHALIQEHILDQTVFAGFPESTAVIARRFLCPDGQMGVWLGKADDGEWQVFASVAKDDLLERYWNVEVKPRSFLEAASIIQKIESSESIQTFRRRIDYDSAMRLAGFWSLSLKECEFGPGPVVFGCVWALTSELNHQVMEGDFSETSTSAPTQRMITLAKNLIAFAKGELSQKELAESIE
ncbi:MAG: hypothetical protein ACREIA_18095 [Opitutaceae bacterium]